MELPQIQLIDDEMVGYWWAWYLVRQWMVCDSSWVLLDGFSTFLRNGILGS